MTPICVATTAPSPQSCAASTRRPCLVWEPARRGQPFPSLQPVFISDRPSTSLPCVGGKIDMALTQPIGLVSPAIRYAQRDIVARKTAVHEGVSDVLLSLREVAHKHSARNGERSQQRSFLNVKHGHLLFMRGLGSMFVGDARKTLAVQNEALSRSTQGTGSSH